MHPPEESKATLGRALSQTPSWLVSAGLHAVLLLGAALVYIERAWSVDTEPIIVDVLPHPRLDPTPPDSWKRDRHHPPEPPADPVDLSAAIDPVVRPQEAMRFEFDPVVTICDGGSAGGPDLRGSPDSRAGRSPGLPPGMHESLGPGAGAGDGLHRGVPGGPDRKRRLTREGGDPATEEAVGAALGWLARHQNADGGWSAAAFDRHCGGGRCAGAGEADYDPGVTSLALLAFLGAGYGPASRDTLGPPGREIPVGPAVKKGLGWLLEHQDPDGAVGGRGPKHLYNHAIAALALSEAVGVTSLEILREPAQRAIDYLVAAQNPGKGWRYQPRSGENDTSVTGWAVMALKSAELSGLPFPRSACLGALAWMSEATEPGGYYRVGYTRAGTGKVYVAGVNESFSDHPSMSAVGVLSRILIERRRDPVLGSVQLLAADLPSWSQGQVDFYYWYYGSLALFQYDGPQGPGWTRWNPAMKAAIVAHQQRDPRGCDRGSWDPALDRWGQEGGRVYAAALNCLTLEVYYRYAHVFGNRGR